jgi:tetraacyldisaccharide 4'-kinase
MANYLNEKNNKVMILMRGYKGKLENKSGLIIAGKKINPDPVDYGDEAILLARRLEGTAIVVGKKRTENLQYYFPKFEPDVVLLDDGHQHIRLKRKLNIVLFDATMPLYKYQVAPLGYLREGFHSLKDADLIVIGKADQATRTHIDSLKQLIDPYLPYQIKFAEVGFAPSGFYNSSYDLVYGLEQIKDKKVILVAGVANPKSFFQIVEKLGAEILITEAFSDHHFFKREEMESLVSYAKSEDALIITTEKDIVRIKNVIEDNVILFMQVELEFFSGEADTKNIIDRSLSI